MISLRIDETHEDAIQVVHKIDESWLKTIETLDPINPFHTRQYIESRRSDGLSIVLIVYIHRGKPAVGCSGYINKGKIQNSLEIMSMPRFPGDLHLWSEFRTFTRRNRISLLSLKTYASQEPPFFPDFGGKTTITRRTEFVIDLDRGRDLWKGISKNHRRNINKGRRCNIRIGSSKQASACKDHVELITATMQRRKSRGEDVETFFDIRWYKYLLSSGCGEIYQAKLDGKIISSVLILRSAQGAYYHSAGTNAEGMKTGASYLIVYEILSKVQKEGIALFNLGGIEEDNPGLVRFKSGFGATTIPLEHRKYEIGTPIQRLARFLGR